MEQTNDTFAFLYRGQCFVMRELAGEEQIDVILAVLFHLIEQVSARASTERNATNAHLACLFALRNRNRKAFRIAKAEADAIDDLGQRDRLRKTDDAAHSRSRVPGHFRGFDGVALVLVIA